MKKTLYIMGENFVLLPIGRAFPRYSRTNFKKIPGGGLKLYVEEKENDFFSPLKGGLMI